MAKTVSKIIKDIKSLKIQGARNVAKAAIEAISIQTKNSKARTLDGLYSELLVVSDKLAGARPTEPMVRNSIVDITRFALMQMNMKKPKTVKEVKELILDHEKELLKRMEKDSEKLWDYGAKLIPKNAFVVTHCHSSSVTGILKRAKKMGKKFTVVACETRPRYQGRKTAKELAAAGIDVTLIVDSAMNSFMRKADICLVGADSITSRGDLINKIGTSTLAHIARMHDVSFFSAAELYKYSPLTIFGTREKIEERDLKEVWEKPPKGVKVRNPAFDVTAATYIRGYVTEVGIIPPQSMFALATEKLGIRIFK